MREQNPSHEVPVIREADDFLFLYETDCPKNKAANRKLGKHELTHPNWPKERQFYYKALLSNRDFIYRKRFETNERVSIADQERLVFEGLGEEGHWRVFGAPESKHDFEIFFKVTFIHYVDKTTAKVSYRRGNNLKGRELELKMVLVVCSKKPILIEEVWTRDKRYCFIEAH